MQMTQEQILVIVKADIAKLKTLAQNDKEKNELIYSIGTLSQLFNLVKKPSENEKFVTSQQEVSRIMAMFEKINIDKPLSDIISIYSNFEAEMKAVEIGQELKMLFAELKQLTTQEFQTLNTKEAPRTGFRP